MIGGALTRARPAAATDVAWSGRPYAVPNALAGRRRPRILFIAEAVTLAHVARPVTLARALDRGLYEIDFAVDGRFDSLFGDEGWRRRTISSIPVEQFLDALAAGRPVYDESTLERYVSEDLGLIGRLAPDLIVGDFRLSLSVSARLAGVPYMSITNAYWSPHCDDPYPMPELPLARWVGLPIGRLLFRLAMPVACVLHSRPLNRVRMRHGLPALSSNLRSIYTDADYVAYADSPGLSTLREPPANHRFLGAVQWSPDVALPRWFSALPANRPLVYVTLGSSGAGDLLETVVEALSRLPVVAAVATAGRRCPSRLSDNVFAAEYLPGQRVAQRAALVICNGGSPTTQQALAAAAPVLGIPSNMDQHLNLLAVRRSGAGDMLRAGRATAARIRRTVDRMLGDSEMRRAAAEAAANLAYDDAENRFATWIHEILQTVAKKEHVA